MRKSIPILLILALFAGIAAAQPVNGNLVFSAIQLSPTGPITGGFLGFLDPNQPGILTTIAQAPTSFFHNWVRMAPNNTDLVVAQCNAQVASTHLINVTPGGVTTPLNGMSPVTATIHGFELDHDNQWVACGSVSSLSLLCGITHVLSTATVTNFATTLLNQYSPSSLFNELAIDRDPGAPMYAIAVFHPGSTTVQAPQILGANRSGITSTIVQGIGGPLLGLNAMELHPRSGDYLTMDILPTDVNRVHKSASPTSLTPVIPLNRPNGAKITQDDHAWIIYGGLTPSMLNYDLTGSAVVTFFQVPLPKNAYLSGIEVYGSQTLVCNQQSPSTVTVNVQSRLQGAGGQQYALAASFARRPGLKLRKGEWLDLDATHSLFFVSALGVWPSVFQNFQGTLNPFGNATARVDLSSLGLPPNLGITVFVAGVIFGQKQGLIQVTNTHWFVL